MTTLATPSPVPAPAPWWGEGLPPWERWPGASLHLAADWSVERGRWESPCGTWYFNAAAADRACGFFPQYMRHTTGQFAGKPFDLLDWQSMLFVRPAFGWMRSTDGLRRFRTAFLEVGKKNGKTQLMSGLAMLLAFADREPGAQVYAAAASDDQARILWAESAKSARACPDFLEDAGVVVFKSSIVQAATESNFRVISSTIGTKHGFNVHGLVIDEFHTQRTRDLYDVLYKGTSARRQPLVALITTAGDDRESICFEEYERAKRVRDDPASDPAFLPVVFEMAPDDDWTVEANWYKSNPSLGVTKTLDYMRSECRAAQAEPRKRNSFLRLELNVWTESRTVWISPEAWEACRRPSLPLDLASLTCCLGVDLSTRQDLTATVAAFRRFDSDLPDVEVVLEPETKDAPAKTLNLNFTVDIVPTFWMPEDTIAERVLARDGLPWRLWIEQGHLRTTPGAVVDYDAVLHEIEDACGRWQVQAIGTDPHNATHLNAWLVERGLPIVEVRQNITSLSAACKLFEQLVISGRLRHYGNPVMSWCVRNAEVYEDPRGNIMPTKPGGDSRGKRRIDGVAATVCALHRLMVAPDEQGYDERAGQLARPGGWA